MRTKRAIKMLMAVGVQRNDAAAFVRTYHKVKDKPVIKLFPNVVDQPPMYFRTKTIYPQTYTAERVVSKLELREGAFDYERYIRHRLSEKLAHGLLDSGFILFEHKEYAENVLFTAKLRVLPPETVEVCTLGNWDDMS